MNNSIPKMQTATFKLNGKTVSIEVEPRTLLVHHLRDAQGLTGTHVGCDTAQCGACAVLVDGRAVKSCSMLAIQAHGAEITTIEGVPHPHPVKDALSRHHGLQCGFCTSGMVISAIDLLSNNKSLNEAEVREGISGNMCRCTGYQGIVDAILEVSSDTQSSHEGADV